MNEFTTSLKDDNRTTQKYVCRKMAVILLETAMVILVAYTFLDLLNVNLSSPAEITLNSSITLISSLALCCIMDIIPFKIKCLYTVSLFCFTVSYMTHNSGLTYLLNTVFTVNLLLLLVYVTPPKILTRFALMVLFICVILVILFAPQYEEKSDTSKFLNLNTNTSGYILFTFFFVVVYYACGFKIGTIKGCLLYSVAILTFFVQLKYGGRSSMLGDVLVLFCIFFKKCITKSSAKKIKRWVFLICAFSIAFTYLYAVVLFNAIGHGNVFFMGKDIFTGRQIIWNDSFDQLRGHILFGLGNNLHSMAINGDTSGVTNVHNQMLGYVVTFGVVGFIPFLFLFSNVTSLYARRCAMMVTYVLVLSVMAYFDTIFYSTDNMKYNCLALVIIAGVSMIKEKKNEKNHSLLLVR